MRPRWVFPSMTKGLPAYTRTKTEKSKFRECQALKRLYLVIALAMHVFYLSRPSASFTEMCQAISSASSLGRVQLLL